MRIRKSLRAAVLAATALVALTGCDHFAADPIAFTRVGDVPVARICLPMTITSIQLKTYVGEKDYTGTQLWAASGSAHVDEGEEFALGSVLPGLTVTQGDEPPSEVVAALGDAYAITINARDAYGSHRFFAMVERADFDKSLWLDGWGPVEAPCVRAPCPQGYACHNQWPQPSGPALDPEPRWTPEATSEP